MLRFLLISALLLPVSVARAAIEITHLAVDKERYVTGEPVQVTMRVANTAKTPVQNVHVQAFFDTASMLVEVHTPDWACPPSLFTVCTKATLSAGAESELRITILAPPRTTDAPLLLTASAGAETRQIPVTVTPAARRAELTLKAIVPENPILPGKAGEITVLAENSGPDGAYEVRVELRTAPFVTIPGRTGQCQPDPRTGYSVCYLGHIPAFTSAPITLRFTAPESGGVVETWGRIQAEMNRDDVANELLNVRVVAGDPDEWQRYLVPITATRIPGANGSLWRTDVTMFFRGTQFPTVDPNPCGVPITCLYPVAPLDQPFDAHEHGYVGFTVAPGQFLHVKKEDVAKVAINARFYDASRLQETAGTELPIVRVDKFRAGTLSLLNVPIAAQFRHTLRLYDGDGRDATVAIRVYADDETTPRVSTTRHLDAAEDQVLVTPQMPAYAELALAQLLPLDGFETLRLEIEPLTPGARIWAFVSITNNETHHVTLVTPQ